MALLTRALGYEDVNPFGISCGPRLALEVMRQAPDGLRGVVIDSVSAPDVLDSAELERRNGQRGLTTAYMPQMIAQLQEGNTDTFGAIQNGELLPATPSRAVGTAARRVRAGRVVVIRIPRRGPERRPHL